ncbi:MAG: stage III sporulation protein AB [Oscillospiraceae bacterium]|nr:stage III sporulation protein AB [Oscillospiraceae bacterium]
MNIKTLGILLIILVTTLTGIRISGEYAMREKRIDCLLLMTDRIVSLIKYGSFHTREILKRVASDKNFQMIEFPKQAVKFIDSGKDFAQAWDMSVRNDSTLGCEEREILLQMGSSLGKSGKKSQISMLEIHTENLRSIRERIVPELRNKRKLYSSLGVLTGIFISVMLI